MLCVRLCVSISEKGILANIIANFNFVANLISLYTVSRWVRQMRANVPKVKLMVNTLKFKCLQSFKKNRVNTIKGTKPSGKLKPCQSHNAWRNVDYEQSLFLQHYWGECTRAQARNEGGTLPSPAFSHARGHLRVLSVSFDGLRKKGDCSWSKRSDIAQPGALKDRFLLNTLKALFKLFRVPLEL